MLSRTADHLYWMARYTERAENTARLLDVNWQMSLLPQPRETAARSWRAMLEISELTPAYERLKGDIAARGVLDFMVRDEGNPSSIAACLHGARENARAVRGSLTTEVWETVNTTWLDLSRQLDAGLDQRDPSAFFEWVKFRSHLSRGVTVGTMQHDEALYFLRIGTFLERADNTTRILDVKFVEAGAADVADPQRDFYHWTALLRSVSSFEIYRRVYRDVVTPERVAELLILRADMPRSLLACLKELETNVRHVRNARSDDTLRSLGQLRSQVEYARIEDILELGLHPYLNDVLERVADLGRGISRDFLVPLQSAGDAGAQAQPTGAPAATSSSSSAPSSAAASAP
jgi:uncharacterized alpha-E superfamily protein